MTKLHPIPPVRILFAIDGLQVEQGEEGLPADADLILRGGNGVGSGRLVALAAEQSLSERVRVLLRGRGEK